MVAVMIAFYTTTRRRTGAMFMLALFVAGVWLAPLIHAAECGTVFADHNSCAAAHGCGNYCDARSLKPK